MEFNSLHSYLDHCFANVTHPSDAAIIKAKADYWKWYRARYQKKRRTSVREFTLGFDKQTMIAINEKRSGSEVSEFLYKCVFQALKQGAKVDAKLFGSIHQHQMEIIMQLEILVENNDSQLTEAILERMEALETQITNLRQ